MTGARIKLEGTSRILSSLISMSKIAGAFAAVLIILSGCAVYTFNPKGKSTIATIADGSMKVVPSESAEAILTGTLTGYNRKPYNPDENDLVESYAVTMSFDITLKNPVDETEIWTERVSKFGTYNIETETEEVGQLEAITLLIEHIINKTTKSW